jgi:hypothetical protein
MIKHKIVLILSLEDDDQSDGAAVTDQIKEWLQAGQERDLREHGVLWPPVLRVEHRGEWFEKGEADERSEE